jgi:hypothetical protein
MASYLTRMKLPLGVALLKDPLRAKTIPVWYATRDYLVIKSALFTGISGTCASLIMADRPLCQRGVIWYEERHGHIQLLANEMIIEKTCKFSNLLHVTGNISMIVALDDP